MQAHVARPFLQLTSAQPARAFMLMQSRVFLTLKSMIGGSCEPCSGGMHVPPLPPQI